MNIVAPDSVGFSSTRLARIRSVMQRYVDQKRIPGVVTMIARRGQIVHAECVGMMDVDARKSIQFDTLFRINSMTKPITSVAVMMLYEEGGFQLDDPISLFIPAFNHVQVLTKATEAGMELSVLEREITIRDLLLHTSGLASGFGADRPLEPLYQTANLDQPESTLHDYVEKLTGLPLLNQPGAAWRYGVSYEVLAYLVEVLSGIPFATFLQQRIFEPLRMVDTGHYVPKDKIERLAVFYGRSETGSFRVIDDAATSPLLVRQRLTKGSSGLVSTVSDYLRFAQMLLNGGTLEDIRLLGRKTVHWMTMNHLPPELMPIQVGPDFVFNGHGFGLGFRVLTSGRQFGVMGSEGEYGWSGYAGTYFWADPQEELLGLFMLQLEPLEYVPMWHAFRTLTYQALVD